MTVAINYHKFSIFLYCQMLYIYDKKMIIWKIWQIWQFIATLPFPKIINAILQNFYSAFLKYFNKKLKSND